LNYLDFWCIINTPICKSLLIVALKKPSDYFKKDIATVNNSVQELVKTPELSTFSDAFESFKNNLSKIEVLSEFTETLDNYRVNIGRVNHLSEKVEDIQEEILNLLSKEDLDRAMMSQLIVVEQSIRDVQSKVKGINEKNLTEIRLDVSNLTESVNEFLQVDVPKYKKLIVDSELRTDDRFTQLEDNVNQTLEGIGEFVDTKYQELTESLQGINEQSLAGILEDFKILDENFISLKGEIPKYKGFIVETERKTESKLEEFNVLLNETVDNLLEKINSVEGDKTNLIKMVNDKIQEAANLRELVIADLQESEETRNEIEKKVTDLEVDIIRNESHIRTQNKNLEQIQEDVKSTIQKLNIDELERQNHKLGKKIKYLEEVFEKFSEKEILTESIVAEPPSTKNEDPLTPLDQNFVTLDQLQQHYRLFINRIQQQLATLGGGGETQLKYLDDIVGIATNAVAYDGKFLKYNHSIQKFEFVTVETGGGTIDTDNISTNSVTIVENSVPITLQKALTATTNTVDPTSIHKSILVADYSTVEYTIQASRGLDIETKKIICVNDTTNINKTEVYSVSVGSTFTSYDINITDGYIDLVVTPTDLGTIVYNVSYIAISRPESIVQIDYIISTENDELILTEDGNMIQTEVS